MCTNFSWLFLLSRCLGQYCARVIGEFKSADSYADMAIRHNRYNAKALVNKGNCLFMSKEYERAKEIFLEAIGVEVRVSLSMCCSSEALGMSADFFLPSSMPPTPCLLWFRGTTLTPL